MSGLVIGGRSQQELMRFDRRNAWNADIVEAARVLLPEVKEPSTLGSLVRLIEELSPQGPSRRSKKPIPSRHASWKQLHELAIDVLDGLGLSYRLGRSSSPGFVVKTWQIWEDLLAISARLGFGPTQVESQKGFALGNRVRVKDGESKDLSVFPDCVISEGEGHPRMLFDAKYKGNVERGRLRIAEADIYEALAFSRAAECNYVVLGYPSTWEQGSDIPLGTCVPFEEVIVGAVRIIGVKIESRSISTKDGLRLFSKNMAHQLRGLFL